MFSYLPAPIDLKQLSRHGLLLYLIFSLCIRHRSICSGIFYYPDL